MVYPYFAIYKLEVQVKLIMVVDTSEFVYNKMPSGTWWTQKRDFLVTAVLQKIYGI